MEVVLDIEADGLKPTKIFVVVCKDTTTGDIHVFREPTSFREFAKGVDRWIGHNIIDYDCYWLDKLGWYEIPDNQVFDTLVLSQLLNQGRTGGHGLEAWGLRLGFPKGDFNDFSQWSQQMEDYCINDVELNYKVYVELMKIVRRTKGAFDKALEVEMKSRCISRDMHHNGFKFDKNGAEAMLVELKGKVATLLETLQTAFPARSKLLREVTPKATKHGTISKVGISTWYKEDDYTRFEVNSPFSLAEWVPFNPGSPPQVKERLWEAGWKPTVKTDSHMDAEKIVKNRWSSKEDRAQARVKLEKFKYSGWKINEENLATLPDDAPPEFGILVEYILTNARVRTLREWLGCFNKESGRIHGQFNPLGTRTHRCSHSNPNMGNIATKKSIKYNTPRLRDLALEYGGRMRSFWIAEDGSYLVGTDMEGAHLRIFAHLIDDKDFTYALTNGNKKDGTDPHSVNKRVLGDLCIDRDRAKTFIFTFLNGGSGPKVSEIFGCSLALAKEALDRFVRNYPGLARIKQQDFPKDADRGYFIGVDGRLVVCDDSHLMMGMVLQNMESVLMKYANVIWRERLDREGINYKQVNWVHDEWVTEVNGSKELAEYVGQVQADSIRAVGQAFGLRCPMAGEYKVGQNWLEVH